MALKSTINVATVPNVEPTPRHVIDCPAIAAALQSLDPALEEDLYSRLAINIAKIIEKHHDI